MRTTPLLEKHFSALKSRPRRWLVTGAAGFIGSHLVEELLLLGQHVCGLDNFANGYQRNLDELKISVGPEAWKRFDFTEGDICDLKTCEKLASKADVILHQAALGSVPRSIANPIASNAANVTGFLNMLTAAKDAGVKRFVFASSSSVYGDNTDLPKVEERTGNPLSPYAVTKATNELYGRVFASTYGMSVIGLRYFNVFGSRQSPNGPYAAVIPKWVEALLHGRPVEIFGDGETSRDFCYVKNAAHMNLLAALTERTEASGRVFNTACDHKTSLNQLFGFLQDRLAAKVPGFVKQKASYLPPRAGDIAHSQAAIGSAQEILGYEALYQITDGLDEALGWYVNSLARK